jgi:lysophospholipase L1-like esterase
MAHVVLLGDSIFDNASYVPGEPSVGAQVKGLLPRGNKVTLLARDGAIVADVRGQIAAIPSSSSHLVLSAGGNDALGALERLDEPVKNVTEALIVLSTIRTGFQRSYHSILELTQRSQKPLAICTIYEAIPRLPKEQQTALSIFNDTIVREALSAGSTIIDLRAICTEAEDFSIVSRIEPSAKGGQKIASAIASWVAAFSACEIISRSAK